MIVTVLIDVSITVMMCWALYRKRCGFQRCALPLEFMSQTVVTYNHRTDSMIMTLLAYTINSGFLVT